MTLAWNILKLIFKDIYKTNPFIFLQSDLSASLCGIIFPSKIPIFSSNLLCIHRLLRYGKPERQKGILIQKQLGSLEWATVHNKAVMPRATVLKTVQIHCYQWKMNLTSTWKWDMKKPQKKWATEAAPSHTCYNIHTATVLSAVSTNNTQTEEKQLAQWIVPSRHRIGNWLCISCSNY